ncbi:membrane-associated protein, putative [Bodo saltans]|uniref:Membrane-associated protein, putative n=1 Tax=Bodo saltans TaxID=75058 RepID=A0A0S4JCQ1_BODSA|nr:membrane-associated protein, putative [Bodo saltans]|eukprot:CUG86950.1 membrane-associated protein, putative [Bodo saltans]
MALNVYAALVALSLALVPSQADCTLYCATNDILSTTTCTASASVVVTYECKTGYSSNSGGPCRASPCFQGGTFCSSDSGASNGGECATGSWKAAGGGCSNPAHTGCLPYCSGGPMGYHSYCCANAASSRCYATTVAEVACPSGTLSADESYCTSNTPVQIVYSCADSRYLLFPNSAAPLHCRRTYPASTIVSQATCTGCAPSTNGCQWCASINVCVATTTTPTCPATCPDAVQATCTISITLCQWCDAATSIGVCQLKTEACYSNCTAATVSQQQECSKSSECQWCPSSTSIGVCQPNSGTCWPTCTPASDDPLGTGVCRISLDCKWCPTLNYCTERPRNCHTLCPTVGPDEPAICQVQSIQSQCQWCGAPGSVEYCVSRTDEARLRCAASCGGLIWRPDVCNGTLECHWCGVHNAAQGGRCKPLPGKSRGCVAWRREVECATGSESDTLSLIVTTSLSISFSPSSTVSVRSTLSHSFQGSLSLSTSGTFSNTQNPSLSNETSASLSMTLSSSHSRFTSSLKVSITNSLSVTRSNSSTSTATLQPTAPRYYWRDRTIVVAVTTFLALGLMVPSVLGGIGGGTMTSSLSRVIASRNVGQCWG